MPQVVDSITSLLERLTIQVEDLERRVAALERPPEEPVVAHPQPAAMPLQRPRPPATWRGFPPVEGSSAVVPILGKAVLGMAGAYLLRALAESSSIPKLPVSFLAICYAYFWMFWAARLHRSSSFASATYGLTSALILSPLLWESTVRFQVLSPAFASVWLIGFVALAVVLAWRDDLQILPWIAALASLGTALALIVATRDLVPLTTSILIVAALFETATCLGQHLTMRAIPMLASAFAVWLLVYVMTASANVPEGYKAADPHVITGLSLLLMTIYGSSIAVRGFAMCERITLLDLFSGALAFGVGSFGVFATARTAVVALLGMLFVLLAGGCYWGALSHFAAEIHRRNRRISASWAAALLLAGTFLLMPAGWREIFFCLAAMSAAYLYARTGKLSLGVHVSIYLAVAVAVSPVMSYGLSALAGSVPAIPDWRFWAVGLCAALCYGIGARHVEDQRRRRLLWILPALLVGFAAAAIAVGAVVKLFAGRIDAGASMLSVTRTIVIATLALMFGIFGFKLRRPELGWAAYAVVGFGTIKLVLEDLRFGNAASLVLSLLFYGMILILLPRLGTGDRRIADSPSGNGSLAK